MGRGGLYRPRKEAITIRLGADVLAWFRGHVEGGRGYQSEINRAVREHVQRAEKQGRQARGMRATVTLSSYAVVTLAREDFDRRHSRFA